MPAQRLKLWDPVVRLCHGSLAVTFFANYLLNESGGTWHNGLGYYALGWLVIRFIWGFIGTPTARWADFWPSRDRLKAHLSALITGQPYHRLGHSPLGALVMIMMMLLMLGLITTGFLMEEVDYFWGEDLPLMIHEGLANSLMLLVSVHLAAALFESYRLKDNLPLSMITGLRKPLPPSEHS